MNSADHYCDVACALQRKGDKTAARDNYMRAIDLDPRHYRSNFLFAHFLLGEGLDDIALHYAEVAHNLTPNPSSQELLTEAIIATSSKEASKADPAQISLPTIIKNAVLLLRIGKKDEAAAFLDFAYDLTPPDSRSALLIENIKNSILNGDKLFIGKINTTNPGTLADDILKSCTGHIGFATVDEVLGIYAIHDADHVLNIGRFSPQTWLKIARTGDTLGAATRMFEDIVAGAFSEYTALSSDEDERSKIVFVCGLEDQEPATPDPIGKDLENIFSTLLRNKLSDKYVETVAIVLSKHFGLHQEYSRGLEFVQAAIDRPIYSVHLKACHHALNAKIHHQALPAHLEKFIGRDNDALKGVVCPAPFKRFDIDEAGGVRMCCAHWMPLEIGNIMHTPLEDIQNGPTAIAVRKSVTDGSYRYCNQLECPMLLHGRLPKHDELPDAIKTSIDLDGFKTRNISDLLFAFDKTCNLSCPSCRSERITEPPELTKRKLQIIDEQILPVLPGLETLYLNVAGEVFVSKISRYLLSKIDRETSPNLHIDVMSNGMLFNEKTWAQISNVHGLIKSVRISIDGASKTTFEKLRRLGVWEEFTKNMAFLKHLRETAVIQKLTFAFTYQLENFREMPAFVDFGLAHSADCIVFERLQRIIFTEAEYESKAVHYRRHPLYSEFQAVLRDPRLRHPKAFLDIIPDSEEAVPTQ